MSESGPSKYFQQQTKYSYVYLAVGVLFFAAGLFLLATNAGDVIDFEITAPGFTFKAAKAGVGVVALALGAWIIYLARPKQIRWKKETRKETRLPDDTGFEEIEIETIELYDWKDKDGKKGDD